MEIMDLIRARKSVRTFDGRPLTKTDSEALESVFTNVQPPFTKKGKVFLSLYSVGDNEALRVPSTYGVIKGARTYILVGVSVADSAEASLAAGYICEAAVLKAVALGAATCWLGGTFSRKDFAPAAGLPEGVRLIAVIPVGYPVDKGRFLERMMRKVAGSDNRKPFGELFFNKQWGVSLSESSEYAEALEAVRLAPSSTNSQPWRVVVDGDKLHFYYKPGRYAFIDMGIALYHFSAACGKEYKYTREDAPESSGPFEYLATITVKP